MASTAWRSRRSSARGTCRRAVTRLATSSGQHGLAAPADGAHNGCGHYDKPGGAIRVFYSLDDGGVGAFHPMTACFIFDKPLAPSKPRESASR